MKKEGKTFAQRAKELEKKYKRAKYDEIEKNELISELRKLRDEQESFRVDNDLDDKEEQEQYLHGGIKIPPFYTLQSYSPTFDNIGKNPSQTGINWNTSLNNSNFQNISNSVSTSQFAPISTSPLPFAISTGVNLLGNLTGMIGAKDRMKKAQVGLPKMSAEQISLEPQREEMRRQAGTATNIALRAGRDVGSPGQAYANQIAGVGSIMDSLGTGMQSSYMNEAVQNAQMRQSANQANMESTAKERLYNAGVRDKYMGEANAYRDAAFSAIPQGLQDYRAQKSQDTLLSTLGKDYGLYERLNPNASFKEKLIRNLFGPTYTVQNKEYVNSL